MSEAVGEGVREEKSFRTLKTEGKTSGLCCPRRGFILRVAVAQDAVELNAGNVRSWQTPGCHQPMWEFLLKSHFCPVRYSSTHAQSQLEKGVLWRGTMDAKKL